MLFAVIAIVLARASVCPKNPLAMSIFLSARLLCDELCRLASVEVSQPLHQSLPLDWCERLMPVVVERSSLSASFRSVE